MMRSTACGGNSYNFFCTFSTDLLLENRVDSEVKEAKYIPVEEVISLRGEGVVVIREGRRRLHCGRWRVVVVGRWWRRRLWRRRFVSRAGGGEGDGGRRRLVVVVVEEMATEVVVTCSSMVEEEKAMMVEEICSSRAVERDGDGGWWETCSSRVKEGDGYGGGGDL
ncbi:hypothetical protein HAX54_038172 [Datura stramonium]|uniref:Uncharacterized protein n=1 Tax=Datura stramonium TaxID=4076 RepID=A0ABS8RNE0_DATST|nr:hypothetical protein [Datura stramonium]